MERMSLLTCLIVYSPVCVLPGGSEKKLDESFGEDLYVANSNRKKIGSLFELASRGPLGAS
jgi:hypothetical protein